MLYLTRILDFSATHSYTIPAWTTNKNKQVFGPCSNQNGHGHDYKLEVVVKGPLIGETGIVMNTVDIKQKVNQFLKSELDGKFLNKENDYFKDHIPTTENIVNYLWNAVENMFDDCTLHRIRLHENHYLFAEKEDNSMTRLTRQYHFCAAHRLHSDHLSDEENIRLFGKCNNPHGHGHNYFVDVTVHGEPDPTTGMIIDLGEMDHIVNTTVIDKFDHKHLNLDTDEFRDLNPTGEVMAMVIFNMLASKIPNLYKIGLWETDKNYFEYLGN
ncbi:6-carboxytetrahydropterin synthase [Bacillus pinisoli]|uniref:6-carboxytetrahydropterin synthase n=1 Tax=Bacillus pinisoli TaxID=2901866 RepID=UPI001FF2DDC6|nr:6-carboxytetrahydropterin synthase [Bacillus pinisoli]